jgi:hypothetical protein
MANRTSCILSLLNNPLVEEPDLVPLGLDPRVLMEEPDLVPLGLDPRVLMEEPSGTINMTTVTIKSGGGIQTTKID